MIDIATQTGIADRLAGNVGLSGHPGEKSVRRSIVSGCSRPPVATERGGERRREVGDAREFRLHQALGFGKEALCVRRIYTAGQDVFLQREEPAIDNGPKGTGLDRRRGESLHQAAVHGFQTMQRGFGFADLDFRCGKAEVLRPFLNPARKEGLTSAVLAANGFEFSAAGAYGFKFVGDRAFEVTQAHGKGFEAAPWHRAGTKSVDDIGAALWADGSHRLNWRSKSGRSRTTMSEASSIVRMP